ncbi:hypothetical protein QR680_017638 [Steinernema hermaphroditum]|uniref:G domain-containing protein n=1 Tax=Steinernema hermaphroditum TaxID=289476 RepID=A0AA39HHC1_9BILA|nr:hypothetical protein QR680_017638 [Steinernema hermaphroditum]
MDSTLVYSTLFEVFFDGAFVGADFRDSDGRKRTTIGELVLDGLAKVSRNGKAIFVTVQWESSQGWSPLATDYAKTRVIGATKYRLEFFTRDVRRNVPNKFALVWEPIGGEVSELVSYNKDRDHVILLLGARHSGKTTFLGDIPSYLRFDDFSSFLNSDSEVPHPSQPKSVDCEISSFGHGGELFSFVDTPGVLDYRCVENDRDNMNTVLKAITILPHVSAVCLVFNPFEEIAEEVLRHQVHFVFSYLPREAAQSVFFLLNKSRCSRTVRLLVSLRTILEEIGGSSGTDIPLDTSNVFFFENVASLAWHLDRRDILHEKVRSDYGRSWKESRQSLLGLLKSVRRPHPSPPHFFEFVRRNQSKTRMIVRKLTILQSKMEKCRRRDPRKKAGSLQARRDSLESKCIECLHYLSRHSILPRNDFVHGYIAYLTYKKSLCEHLDRYREEKELVDRLWAEAEDTSVFDISFFVSGRSESDISVAEMKSRESLSVKAVR